jgi:pre-mRNA cleavage complex 2 protein Pcf11
VLDSIIKNVGTPYTVYLGRNLYNTFMGAYTLVDPMTRRAMDNLLKTWKEPVPGLLDTKPVFGQEITRPIENALIKAKTAALQNQRTVPGQPPFTNTPTPPQFNGNYPLQHQAQHHQPPPGNPYAQTSTPLQQQWQMQYPPTPQQASQLPAVNVEALKAEISALISRLQSRFASNPNDQAIRTQLQALLQLQKLMDSGAVVGHALYEVQSKVSALAAVAPPPTPQPAPTQHWQPPQPAQYTYQLSVPAPAQYQTPQPINLPFMQPSAGAQPPPAPSTLAPGALNGLQALLANGQKPSTPQMRAAVPSLQNAPHTQLSNLQGNVALAAPTNTADLLAALSKSGVLSSLMSGTSALPTQTPATTVPVAASSTASLLQSLSTVLPPSQRGTPPVQIPLPPTTTTIKPRVPIASSALKTFRPDLLRTLYDDLPNQCSTCGRRFLADPSGRARKERHLDWHFRTNQRMADPNISRGQHRQWFVDEVEWISIPEFDPSTASATDAAESAAAAQKKKIKGPADQYIRAPAGVTRFTCSICQEDMRSQFSEELQDWVFMNATYYNGEPAHATCVAEMTGLAGGGGGSLAAALAGAGSRQRSATPDSALGKRKAEGVLGGQGPRVKMG